MAAGCCRRLRHTAESAPSSDGGGALRLSSNENVGCVGCLRFFTGTTRHNELSFRVARSRTACEHATETSAGAPEASSAAKRTTAPCTRPPGRETQAVASCSKLTAVRAPALVARHVAHSRPASQLVNNAVSTSASQWTWTAAARQPDAARRSWAIALAAAGTPPSAKACETRVRPSARTTHKGASRSWSSQSASPASSPSAALSDASSCAVCRWSLPIPEPPSRSARRRETMSIESAAALW
mmetsp:Transcript_32618/g.112272  ORF Transcript_32618/g.112272 Transcript_32618/m.112272 type:complete len:242 (-) Transcript_32618:409-1134(-)